MPETAAAKAADSDCTDFTTMDDSGVEVVIDAAAQERLRRAEPGRLGAGVRLIFRATLARDDASQPEPRVGVDTRDKGPHRVPRARGRATLPLRAERSFSGPGASASCAGYLLRGGDGSVRARLLLHEPYECLRRIEADLLEAGGASPRAAQRLASLAAPSCGPPVAC